MHNALAKRAAPSPKPTLTDHMFNHSTPSDIPKLAEFNGQFTPQGRACSSHSRESRERARL